MPSRIENAIERNDINRPTINTTSHYTEIAYAHSSHHRVPPSPPPLSCLCCRLVPCVTVSSTSTLHTRVRVFKYAHVHWAVSFAERVRLLSRNHACPLICLRTYMQGDRKCVCVVCGFESELHTFGPNAIERTQPNIRRTYVCVHGRA